MNGSASTNRSDRRPVHKRGRGEGIRRLWRLMPPAATP